jgi:hypothetical protein
VYETSSTHNWIPITVYDFPPNGYVRQPRATPLQADETANVSKMFGATRLNRFLSTQSPAGARTC